MEKTTNQELNLHIKAAWVLKAMLGSYLVTGALLLLLAFLMYKFNWDEGKISAGIIVIYVLSTLVGGFVIGKCAKAESFCGVWHREFCISPFCLSFRWHFTTHCKMTGETRCSRSFYARAAEHWAEWCRDFRSRF